MIISKDEWERLKRAEKEAAEYREALEWYAAKVNDCNRHGPDGNAARDCLAKDTGDCARNILSKYKGKDSE